jgi:hypothetical protein
LGGFEIKATIWAVLLLARLGPTAFFLLRRLKKNDAIPKKEKIKNFKQYY